MLVTLAGQLQILIVSARNVMGVTVEDGRQLWQSPWLVQNENAIAQPVLLGPNRFLISAGYGLGCAAFEIIPSNSVFAVRELSRFQAIAGKTWHHPALADGKIYLRNSVEMACYDLRITGQTP